MDIGNGPEQLKETESWPPRSNPDAEDRWHPRRRLRHHPGQRPIAIVPNASKSSEEAPDYRVINRKTGFEIGAAGTASPARPARNTSQ